VSDNKRKNQEESIWVGEGMKEVLKRELSSSILEKLLAKELVKIIKKEKYTKSQSKSGSINTR